MPYPKVQIEITEKSFKVLYKWASVSRTITESIRLLEDLCPLGSSQLIDEIMSNINELEDLKYALDDCNSACKNLHSIQNQSVEGICDD